MKSMLTIIVLLSLLAGVSAQAQVTVGFVERLNAVSVWPSTGPSQHLSEVGNDLGLFLRDFERAEGNLRAHSVHDSSIVLSGASLTVTGTFLSEVSSGAAPDDGSAWAQAALVLHFTVDTLFYLDLDATVDAGGAAWVFDLTDGEYLFDHDGPGHFTEQRILAPGHQYSFNVDHSVYIPSGGELSDVANATFFLGVSDEPIATETSTWGAIRNQFR